MATRCVDTNILLRYFTRDDEAKAQRVLELLTRVERGEEKVETSIIVIFETVYTLQRLYAVPRSQIRELLTRVLELRGFQLPNKRLCEQALELYANSNVSFADAYHVVYLKSRPTSELYSWDTDFDKFPGVKGVEP
jgi:uncharacterized protein